MELQEVEVFIAPDGTTRIEVRGVAGAACLDLTEDLEKALGGRIVERELTAEAQAVIQQRTEEQLRRGPGS
ncbi:DUF2997 domain-containing protein [Streptomyces sp. TRM70350]|uniref:DUF2997 domain-containing protein n=1 Tax=Streptomyces sp. TRM70350 TaxID=2856165 RepID=UPI001C451FDE|nr:DUF2997 domain-containing protein [Streptomyces sp. TRM70350]MBV7700391.1 DUF2997 domain-containing protein [Streptomyces sp. TRM70350]